MGIPNFHNLIIWASGLQTNGLRLEPTKIGLRLARIKQGNKQVKS